MIFNGRNLNYYILGTASLFLGLLIYLLFGPDTYISRFVERYVSFPNLEKQCTVLNNEFVRFYLADFLWAFSMSCWLHIAIGSDLKGSICASGIVTLSGFTYECLQIWDIVNGTGDIFDVVFYVLAAISVNIITFQRRMKK